MYDVWRNSDNSHAPPCDRYGIPNVGDQDVWLFTDPMARATYSRQGRLDQLRDDILERVLWCGRWSSDELELDQELLHLRRAKVLVEKGTASYLSPHPTVFRAHSEGHLKVAGRKHHFYMGDDVVFLPWLARTAHPGHTGPVWIGRLQAIDRFFLTHEVLRQASRLCECGLSLLRQTLPDGGAVPVTADWVAGVADIQARRRSRVDT